MNFYGATNAMYELLVIKKLSNFMLFKKMKLIIIIKIIIMNLFSMKIYQNK